MPDIKFNQLIIHLDQAIRLVAIIDNLMYIIFGGSDKLLKIWNFKTNVLIK